MSAPGTHATLFYDGARDYATETGGFLRDGLERGHRGLVMAPPHRIDQVRAELGRDADEVSFVADTVAYAPQWNVYRELLDFAAMAPGVRTCAVAEQTLAARTSAEVVDYRRLEAAINVVFADTDVDLLCPYDAGSLPAHLLEIASHSHDTVLSSGTTSANVHYDDPFDVLTGLSVVVPAPLDATTLDCSFASDVSAARRVVTLRGAEVGLDPEVVADMALAVTEVLTNAIVHGAPPTLLHLYVEGSSWICHVEDGGGGLMGPLVGVVPPSTPSDHGYGLWLARQLCIAVDVGHDRAGTHVRLHARAG